MGSERPDLGSNFGPERPNLRSERLDLGSERFDLGSERFDLGSEGPDLGSERPDLGSDRSDLKLQEGGWTDGRKPQKIALCGIIGHRPPGAAAQKEKEIFPYDS